jgi:hypothetical protein
MLIAGSERTGKKHCPAEKQTRTHFLKKRQEHRNWYSSARLFVIRRKNVIVATKLPTTTKHAPVKNKS